MTILQGDIKLNMSKVMLDVPEGGGGPTANVIPDGVSNAIFQDISELDRVNGRVNLRQLHVTVQSDNVDHYLGSNVIVAKPPDDPNVSITLFSTGESFDKRADAVARMEAYLNVGATYPGYLFGNHIAGQATLLMFQRSTTVPAVGETLVLTKREGYNDEFRQYVRVIEVSVVETVFEDAEGEYRRNVVTLELSDALRADFFGYDVTRYEITAANVALRTKISQTVVANAARYFGVVALTDDASLGDFTVKAQSMFTQLVPSAQVETPIADARTNQVSLAVTSAGAPVTVTIVLFGIGGSTPVSLFAGGAIVPGSFTLNWGPNVIVLTDDGGRIFQGSSQVGTIDYENGAIVFNGTVFGTGTFSADITYRPGAVPTAVSQSQGFEITQANRALNYIRTIEPPPLKGSLNISYRANDRWYVLRDDGSGALRGTDSSIGAGMVNFTTGTVSITLGALPDVDSMVIYQWVQPGAASEELTVVNGGKFYWPINADGLVSEEDASKPFTPNYVSISWNDGIATRTVTDDGNGNLTGYGTGTVEYARGVARLSPTTLPPKGTTITVAANTYPRVTESVAVSTSGSEKNFYVGSFPVKPHSVYIPVPGQRKFTYQGGALTDFGDVITYVIVDTPINSTDGKLILLAGDSFIEVGGINYDDGTFWFDISTNLNSAQAKVESAFDNMYTNYFPEAIGLRSS